MSETNYAVAPGEYIEEWLEDNHRSSTRLNADRLCHAECFGDD